jgi:hypothetical protein
MIRITALQDYKAFHGAFALAAIPCSQAAQQQQQVFATYLLFPNPIASRVF